MPRDRIKSLSFGRAPTTAEEVSPGWSQSQTVEIVAMAQRMVDVINESLRIANGSKNFDTRRSRVRVARERLAQLQELAAQFPFLNLVRLEDVGRDLEKIDLETTQLFKAHSDSGKGKQIDDGFARLPLTKQCAALGIPLDEIQVNRAGGQWLISDMAYKRPEDAALGYFLARGYSGTACEGSAILMLMKSACLDFLTQVNTFQSRHDACLRYFEAQCLIHRKRSGEIIREIESANETVVRANLREIVGQPGYYSLYPPMDEEALVAIWRALPTGQLANFAGFILKDFDYRAGWPDLTLVRGQAIMFVEVKTTDKLHAAQKNVIQNILCATKADVRVLRIKPQKR